MTTNSSIERTRSIALTIFKVFAWSLMAIVLALCAVSLCIVKTLRPQVLTPLLCRVAQNYLNADVQLARAELSLQPSAGMLYISLDSLCIISHSLDTLSPLQRAGLPVYSDSLVSIDALRGSLNVHQLLLGNIAVKNVELVRPGVNIVIGPDGTSNFDIYTAAPDTSRSEMSIPAFTVDHFRFIEPRSIRYFNALDSTQATVLLLATADVDGTAAPSYSLKVDGSVDSPVAQTLLQLPDVHFRLDGRLHWNPAHPQLMSVDNFEIEGAFMRALVSADVNLGESLVVNSASFSTNAMPLTDLVGLLPQTTRREYGLDSLHFGGNAALSVTGELLQPFNASTDSIPYAQATLKIEPSDITLGGRRFHNFSLDVNALLGGNNVDSTSVNIRRFTIAGPATDLTVEACADNFATDPHFETCVRGRINLAHLPPKVRALAKGYLSGIVEMDIDAVGNASMFDTRNFHKLYATGTATAHKLFYLSQDTSHMVAVRKVDFNFGTHNRYAGTETPTLSGRLSVDSVQMLFGGVGVNANGLRLGLGVENTRRSADTTEILPMGGGIRLQSLQVLNIGDSAGMRLRDLDGRVALRRFKGSRHVPEISINSNIGRISAGAPIARIVIRDASLSASAYMRPDRVERHREIRHLTDSISRAMPHLSPDSVYALALEKRRRNRGVYHRRVTIDQTSDDSEIIEWHLANGFRKFLLNWRLNGALTTRRARLFTPFFPLTNRFSKLDLAFSNDSVVINGLSYKAGHSDLAIQGIISDIRKALTGRQGSNSLKINLDILSDTVDVNQLASSVFAGADFAERFRNGKVAGLSADKDEDELDRELEALVDTAHEAPAILIPVNLDASINVKANNILYSDLHLTDFDGRLLMYDGALNLNHLRAVSPAGSVNISALYSAPRINDIKFGMGLQLNDFQIERFLNLVPAIDSIMPLMRDFSGTINADIAATVDIDSMMNMVLPTLDAAVSLNGTDLAFIDADTYRTIGKWLRFRDKADNRIKHMSVQLLVKDNRMQIFPFTFDIDRYKLCVAGYNDLAMNFDYHIAVLKSPLPFKFGVTVKGDPEHYKVRLGGAKYREGAAVEQIAMVDTTRVNLINEIENVFRRGVTRSRFARLNTAGLEHAGTVELGNETLSREDSILVEQQGLSAAQLDSLTAAKASAPVIKTSRKRKRR